MSATEPISLQALLCNQCGKNLQACECSNGLQNPAQNDAESERKTIERLERALRDLEDDRDDWKELAKARGERCLILRRERDEARAFASNTARELAVLVIRNGGTIRIQHSELVKVPINAILEHKKGETGFDDVLSVREG